MSSQIRSNNNNDRREGSRLPARSNNNNANGRQAWIPRGSAGVEVAVPVAVAPPPTVENHHPPPPQMATLNSNYNRNGGGGGGGRDANASNYNRNGGGGGGGNGGGRDANASNYNRNGGGDSGSGGGRDVNASKYCRNGGGGGSGKDANASNYNRNGGGGSRSGSGGGGDANVSGDWRRGEFMSQRSYVAPNASISEDLRRGDSMGQRNYVAAPRTSNMRKEKVEVKNPVVPKNSSVPQLVQEIQEKLMKGTVECMICYDMVRRSAPIWSCSSCYSIFHLNCIKKWARAPTSVDLSAEKNQGLNWRCPGCQSVQLLTSKEIRYMCFCGKRPDPPSDLYLTPHSCGEPCGKPLERQIPIPGSCDLDGDLCPHVCVLQCHPGPCPPCKAFAPARVCPCGKKKITTRCSDRMSVLTCGQRCDKVLGCGRHHCKKTCHIGPCEPCKVLINAACFCQKNTEVILCGEMSVKGELRDKSGVFSCNSICAKTLACGNHTCEGTCHPGPCGECDLMPWKVKSCHCGKTKLQQERNSCLDPIPTCPNNCGKTLPCGIHSCKEMCHIGICSPCLALVNQKCRCGSSSRTVECYRKMEETNAFLCEKPCGKKKNCGRHRCSERCCPLSSSNNQFSGDWDPHMCLMNCGKKLRCGQHCCESLCHSGHCPPCLETIFTDLTCACGKTSIPPPQPCGTPPPSCQHPCSVPQPCGHASTHACHFGDCLPCSVPVAKECIGGHVVLRNIPCGSKEIRCNQLCGKTRQCGMHACARTCHMPPCDVSSGSGSGSGSGAKASCGQVCGAPRRDCRHTCTANCHPSAPCPDLRCDFPVMITCSCGRLTSTAPCHTVTQKSPVPLQSVEANTKKTPFGFRKLVCDEDCAKMERKRVLADAFDINPPNIDSLHFGESGSVSELLADVFRREPKWVASVEERFKYLVRSKSRGGNANGLKVHVFCPMLKEKRDAVREIAERWKLSVHTAGWEPKRFVVVHVTPKSKVPSTLLSVKSSAPSNLLHPPFYDPLIDMDMRLVVALLDLPRDADVSALVLRFGGECELVWLNDKNALAVFSDPARAATAMRRLDNGSAYHGAVVIPPNSAASSGTNTWAGAAAAKDAVVGGANLKANPWKKAVVQEAGSGEDSWGSEDNWPGGAGDGRDSHITPWKGKEAPISASRNRYNVLEYQDSVSTSASVRVVESSSMEGSSSTAGPKMKASMMGGDGTDKQEETSEVAEDWEEVYE